MVGRVENVKGAVADFVVRELSLFKFQVFMHDNEGARMRRRAESIVDQACGEHLVCGQQVRHFPHVLASRPIHAAPAGVETRRVGEHGGLHGKFGRVRERSDFPCVLVVLRGKGFLRFRVSIIIDHALDVSGGHRAKTAGSKIAEQRHRHSRLVTIGMGKHYARPVRFGFENRPEQGIELCIHQDDMLPRTNRVKDNACARGDGTGYFKDDIDSIAGG